MLNNNVNLVGRLTKDIELKKTSNGISVASFSLAVNDRKDANNNQISYFFNVVAWKQFAEFLSKYAHKGDLIGIQGRLTTRQYDNQRGDKVTVTEVVADDVKLLAKSQNNAQKSQNVPPKQDNIFYNNYQEQKSYSQSPLADMEYSNDIDFSSDDLPF